MAKSHSTQKQLNRKKVFKLFDTNIVYVFTFFRFITLGVCRDCEILDQLSEK